MSKAAIVNRSGMLLYYGNINNAKFRALLPGNTQVDIAPPDDDSIWDGSTWSASPSQVLAVPGELREGSTSGNASNADLNAVKAFLRERFGYSA